MSLPTSAALASTQHSVPDLKRPLANFTPTVWGDSFLQHASSQSMDVDENVKQQAQILKEKVKSMFQTSVNPNIKQKLNLIDSVQRFGVSYHFKQEINEALEQIHHIFTKNNTIIEDDDHHSLALLFRLLRQQGYHISSNVFKKFKNDQGNFKETLANDIQGLCSLYEAAHLRIHEDDILEEALEFSNTHLKSLANQISPSLAAEINHCLEQPFNKSVARFEVRYHMALYEQDPSHNETLLAFAKLDFNILQKMYQKEVGNITKWWKKSNFVIKIPFARDRLIESYLWSLGTSYKPEYSNGRMFLGKMIYIMTILDDTYDAYGTFQELELFTEAIHRWDIRPLESLPQCMKSVFDTLVELCEEIESMTNKSGRSSFVVPYFKQGIFNFTKGYMIEAKWCHEGYIPTYDEYRAIGVLTTGLPLLITSFIGPLEFVTKDAFDWTFSDPNINEVASVIGRFLGDVASHKFEHERVHIASVVECCMEQYGFSQAEAYNLIHNDVEDCWKVINKECLKSNDIPKIVLDCIVNLARTFHYLYGNQQDKFTNLELLKDDISALLVDPVRIDRSTLM